MLLRAFTTDEAVIDLGTVFLKIVALLQVPLALTMVLAGSLRGAGDTRFIMIATMVGMWGVRVPIAFIAGLWLDAVVFYVWRAMIADWTVAWDCCCGATGPSGGRRSVSFANQMRAEMNLSRHHIGRRT